MAPRGGGGSSGGGAGRAGGSSSSAFGTGLRGGSSSTSSISGGKGGSSGSIPMPKAVTGTKGGSSSATGSKGGSSLGWSSNGFKAPKAPKAPKMPKLPKIPKIPKAPKYNGGSSSTGNYYYDPYETPHGHSGTYVSAAIPSMKNPLSFLNMRSGRKPLVKYDANISASKYGVSAGRQHYSRQVEATSIVNRTVASSTTLDVPPPWQGTIKEGDTAGHIGLILFALVFSILFLLLRKAGKACLAPPRPVERIEKAKSSASGESVPDVRGPRLGIQKGMGYEKVSLAEEVSTDVTASVSAVERPATDSKAARYGWISLGLLLSGFEWALLIAAVLYTPHLSAFLYPGKTCIPMADLPLFPTPYITGFTALRRSTAQVP
ncbi:MAG: hypothetical protein Q9208_007104 [Pyrenodesmia sp. 3 TL-2023]